MSSIIPEEIIIDIFSRLLVKSILRFRCVCKPWCNLFRDPNFVKMHLNYQNKNNFSLMLNHDRSLYSIDFNSSSSSSSTLFHEDKAVKIDHPFKSRERDKYHKVQILSPGEVKILGSCNGLLSIKHNRRDVICIWNPSTKEYKKIPSPPPIEYQSINIFYYKCLFGFGYDCKTEDYKLVRIVIVDDVSQISVYTIRSNSWRSIQTCPYRLYTYYGVRGKLVNGALHWIATRPIEGGSKASSVIVSFNISNERFQEIQLPNCFVHKYPKKMFNMGLLRGSLCLIDNDSVKGQVEIWVMKNYGVIESWTKLFTISQWKNDFKYLRPIQFLKNGEIVFESLFTERRMYRDLVSYERMYKALVSYDPKHERARILNIQGILNEKWFSTETFVGSLVSLNSSTYVGQEQIEEAVENEQISLKRNRGTQIEELSSRKRKKEGKRKRTRRG
ncbi:F-box domain [Macleaya cordata]|uniref:F-box domain n=1 Tax=Macleaya cordata TaxID=56857 RepID=A0A200PSM3_MACCD|nr:F-box domain [Macleaya cordata]